VPAPLIPLLPLLAGAALFSLAPGPSANAQESSAREERRHPTPIFCGGLAGLPCPEGFTCVDDPSDDCDPQRGDADCAGICVRTPPGHPECTGNEPGYRYVSREPAQCAAILFTCPGGSAPFFNACGCGCRRQDTSCDYSAPLRTWVSKDPNQCAAIRFFCNPGQQPFFDDCGCGCEPAP